MPRKVGEMIRLIEADGWYLVATKGSHRQYKHPDKPNASPWRASRATLCIRALNGAS